ncbi:cell wall hydrolase [Evtepia sp.]|nr:cell wall hydrolase [Candidatus Evtepia faecavium]
MKKILTAALLCMALAVTMVPGAFAADTGSNYTQCMAAIQEQKTIQSQAHQTAESLRQQGYGESSSYIKAAQAVWWDAQAEIVAYQKLAKYTDEDIRILTTAVFYEAGHTTDQLREYVAQVVLNRVADSRFPDTVKGVITQPGQYATKYATQAATNSVIAADKQNGTSYYSLCQAAVKKAMMGQVDMPSNVIYQANFAQGKGVWKSVYFNSGWFASTSYFCYG